ncbi:hypothetical protein BDFG_09092 [Blastomyces dermatitidis ATCC 26199]|nr:hypothetical protein BDFG_09092 [Blastomyces dermatitidis ATCC 26199]
MKAEAVKPGVVKVEVTGTGIAGAGEPDTGASVGDWGVTEKETEREAAEKEAAEETRENMKDSVTHDTDNFFIITFFKFLIKDSTSDSLSSADTDLSTHEDSMGIKTNISASASMQNCVRKYNQKSAEKKKQSRMYEKMKKMYHHSW